MTKFRVAYRHHDTKPGQEAAGDTLIIYASDERDARKQARATLSARFFGPAPKIAWVDRVPECDTAGLGVGL